MAKKNREVSWHTLSFICSLTKTLRPEEHMTVGQWADKNMVLPEGSNASGRFTTSNVPYQKEIMDAITDLYVTDVSVMSSAQVGKTTIILCGIGYYIDHEPSTQLLVLPTLTLGEKFSKTRLAAMIRDVPVLREKITPAKAKDSDNTILFKSYPGGHIVVAGANSAASLSSMPIRVVWMDETDRFPESAGTEGNPIKLAEARSKTFWNKKRIKTSTPTIHGKSKIEDAYNAGTAEEWCVQCPCCGTWQPYEFKRVVFSNVSMKCIHCKEEIPEMDWKESPHKWIAGHPERRHHRSFHLNEMASPWVSWKEIIKDFKDAKAKLDKYHDPNDLKTFINTVLGESWKETELDEESVDDKTLAKRAEHYEADIPDGVLLLTAAVDVQDNRFEIEVRGWARDYETWGIYKTEIYGNLEKSGVWDELEEYLKTTFYFGDGRELNIAATAIDTGGHYTNATYKWIKYMKKKGKRVYGVKGYSQKPDIPLVYKRTKVDIKEETKNGKEVVVDSTVIHILGVDAGKEDITKRLTIEKPGEGYCHFPSNPGRGYDKEYYEGLTSEHKIDKEVRGVLKKVWVKKSGVRNEPLDLFNYNYAACEILRPVWGELEAKINRGINYMKAKKVARRRTRKSQDGMEV